MSLIGKNRSIYSYNNADRKGRKFVFKDFEKTKSYHTDFSGASFTGVSLRAAQMKYCNFTDCIFSNTDFIGANLRGSRFINAVFTDCIFVGTVLENANFKGAIFRNCYFVSTGRKNTRNFPEITYENTILSAYPPQDTVDENLKEVIESLRSNDFIRRSNTLHLKEGKVNTLTVMILKDEYTNEELTNLLPLIPDLVTTQFYTVSYLKKLLKKAEK